MSTAVATARGGGRVAGAEVATLGLLLVAVFALQASLLRPGHLWSDDFAMYIAHAQNLLAGRPYGDTGYIANPWAVPGPATYPPVYPLLIAPLLALQGADLQLLKVLDLVFFCLALGTGYGLLRGRVGHGPALGLMAVLGVTPFLPGFLDEVRPDSLFLLFFLLTLWLGERWTGQRRPLSSGAVVRGGVLGVVAYLAYGTRSVGMVLLPALLAVELWRLRRPSVPMLVAWAVALGLAALQSATLHGDGGYARLVTLDPQTLRYNATSYLSALSLLWSNGLDLPWSRVLRGLMFVAVSALALAGYVHCLRRGPTVLEAVPLFYLAPLVCYWVGTMIQQRYMLPLFPIYLYHAWVGWTWLRDRPSPVAARAVAGLVLAGAVVGHASAYAAWHRAEPPPALTDAVGQQVLAFTRDGTPSDAVLLVGRARAFALYGQRTTVSPYGFRTDEALWRLIGEHGITHVVVGLGPLATDMDYEHPHDLARFVAAHPQRLQRVFANAGFEVYAVGGSHGNRRP